MAVAKPMEAPAAAAASETAAVTTPSASGTHDPKSIIADNNCLSCHRIGSSGGEIGPTLNGVGTRHTPDQIQAIILHPPAKTSAGTPNPMPSYAGKITGEDLTSLVHYLSTLPAQN